MCRDPANLRRRALVIESARLLVYVFASARSACGSRSRCPRRRIHRPDSRRRPASVRRSTDSAAARLPSSSVEPRGSSAGTRSRARCGGWGRTAGTPASPRGPPRRHPVYCTVRPRITTASGVATWTAAFTVPAGATMTCPLVRCARAASEGSLRSRERLPSSRATAPSAHPSPRGLRPARAGPCPQHSWS